MILKQIHILNILNESLEQNDVITHYGGYKSDIRQW